MSPHPSVPLPPAIPRTEEPPTQCDRGLVPPGMGMGRNRPQGGGIGKWRGPGHPSLPRSQHSHPLGMGVYDLFQRQDLKGLGDQVRVFPSSLLEHLPGRKPEIESVVPHPALGKRPWPRVGVLPESRGMPWIKSLPKHLLSWWDGLRGQCSGCRGPWGSHTQWAMG